MYQDPTIKIEQIDPGMKASEVVDFYTRLESLGVKIWVDGGWGVDALLGEQSRIHKDLDIGINQKDVPELLKFLEKEGFAEIKRDSEYNVVFRDKNGREIDYHAFITNEEGKVIGGIAYPDESLTGIGNINGVEVRCISPEYVVKFHSGYELKGKDYKDVSAVCQKFGIDLPEEYKKFQ